MQLQGSFHHYLPKFSTCFYSNGTLRVSLLYFLHRPAETYFWVGHVRVISISLGLKSGVSHHSWLSHWETASLQDRRGWLMSSVGKQHDTGSIKEMWFGTEKKRRTDKWDRIRNTVDGKQKIMKILGKWCCNWCNDITGGSFTAVLLGHCCWVSEFTVSHRK